MFFKRKQQEQVPKPDPLYEMAMWLLNNRGYADGPDTQFGGKVDYAPQRLLIKKKMGPTAGDFIQLTLHTKPFSIMMMRGNAGWVEVFDGVNRYHTDRPWETVIQQEYEKWHG